MGVLQRRFGISSEAKQLEAGDNVRSTCIGSSILVVSLVICCNQAKMLKIEHENGLRLQRQKAVFDRKLKALQSVFSRLPHKGYHDPFHVAGTRSQKPGSCQGALAIRLRHSLGLFDIIGLINHRRMPTWPNPSCS